MNFWNFVGSCLILYFAGGFLYVLIKGLIKEAVVRLIRVELKNQTLRG